MSVYGIFGPCMSAMKEKYKYGNPLHTVWPFMPRFLHVIKRKGRGYIVLKCSSVYEAAVRGSTRMERTFGIQIHLLIFLRQTQASLGATGFNIDIISVYNLLGSMCV